VLPIVWAWEARADLAELLRYIGDRNPAAAYRMHEIVQAAVEGLAVFPMAGRVGRIPGTRELVAHPNYVIVYRVEIDQVRVTNVLHARQQYP
jgi:toxin ParE1/3/4